MNLKGRFHPPSGARADAGFSLLELAASVAIIGLLMGAVFSFMAQAQRRFQSDLVIAGSNQTARAAMEFMSQEIGQAGFNPVFAGNLNKTAAGPIIASARAQCVMLNNITQINPNDWVAADSGPAYELVKVTSTSNVPSSPCTASNQIQGVFQVNHPALSLPVNSYKAPYPSGILSASGQSDDKTLEFFGDVYDNGTLQYAVYSLYCPSGATTVTINGGTYTLCKLERSVTPITFASSATNNQASPLVQNVLYNTSLAQGPTGQPIFNYNKVTLGVVPTVFTVVGTVTVTLSVAVNPQALEAGGVIEYYTMATQVRPLNLTAAIAVNSAGGVNFLPALPAGLPMSNPSNYYQ